MPYEPDRRTPSRVYCNGERLPALDVDIWMRKEGSLDIGRYAEIEFASPWNGEDFADAFNGLDPDTQGDWDVLRVDIKDEATDEYSVSFKGMVTAVGNGVGPEKIWKARAQGPALFTDKVPASQTFDDARVRDVLQYCAFELAEKFPLTIPVETYTAELQDSGVLDDLEEMEFSAIGSLAGFLDDVLTEKSFQSNKHTIADVLGWLDDRTGARFWFEPTTDRVVLVGSKTPTERNHIAHYLGGETAIENNDALIELNPVNTVRVKGTAANTWLNIGDFEVNAPGRNYYTAVARHTDLYRRAGEQEYLAEPEFPSDANSKTEVQNEAKSVLKDRIDRATAGDMQTLLKAPIKPYDTIEAKPTCDSSPATNVPPITYEVSRVHHKIRPGDSDENTGTELNVGVHAALDDIEVIDTWESEA